MPVAAAAICLVALKVVGLPALEAEIARSSAFRRRGVFRFVLRYLALALLAVILVSSLCEALGLIHI